MEGINSSGGRRSQKQEEANEAERRKHAARRSPLWRTRHATPVSRTSHRTFHAEHVVHVYFWAVLHMLHLHSIRISARRLPSSQTSSLCHRDSRRRRRGGLKTHQSSTVHSQTLPRTPLCSTWLLASPQDRLSALVVIGRGQPVQSSPRYLHQCGQRHSTTGHWNPAYLCIDAVEEISGAFDRTQADRASCEVCNGANGRRQTAHDIGSRVADIP